MAPPGEAVAVSILCSSFNPLPYEEELRRKGYTPIMSYQLGEGEYATFGARQIPFDDGLLEMQVPKGNVTWLEGAPGEGETISNASAILICNRPADGRPLLLANVSGLTVGRSNQTS